MKEFFKKLWEKIKKWAAETALPWLKKSWMQIVNILVVFMAYGRLYNIANGEIVTAIVGLWLFILLAYYIFWKLFGFDKLWKKMMEDRKRKRGFDPQPEPFKPIVDPVIPQPERPVEPEVPAEPIQPETITKTKPVAKKATAKKKATTAKKPVKKTTKK